MVVDSLYVNLDGGLGSLIFNFPNPLAILGIVLNEYVLLPSRACVVALNESSSPPSQTWIISKMGLPRPQAELA